MSEDEELPLPTRKGIDMAADALIESGKYTADSVRAWAASVKVRDEEQDPEEILPSIY